MIIILSHNGVVEEYRVMYEYMRMFTFCHCSTDLIYYYFIQVLGMTIPRTSSRFRVIGSMSRSQWLFFRKKKRHHSSVFICATILMLFHAGQVLDKFEF